MMSASPDSTIALRTLSERRELSRDVDTLWDAIGGFFSIADWHPGIARSDMRGGGRCRHIVLADDTEFDETLVGYDLDQYCYRYAIQDPSPLPFRNYLSSLRIDPNGDECTVVWSARYEPEEDAADVHTLIQSIFKSGLDGLEQVYGKQ